MIEKRNEVPKSLQAKFDEPELVQNLVERIANSRRFSNYLQHSSLECYASGTITYSFEDKVARIPFITCFIFSCMKAEGKGYIMEMMTSLS